MTIGSAEKPKEKADEKSSGSTSGKPEPAASSSKETIASSSVVKPSSDRDSQEDEESFQKHDHSKYVRMIKNKAIDQVNKHPGAKLAILCRNRNTDQWSLTMYFQGGRGYSYVSYDWDDVDENWVKIFEDKNLPSARWRQHVRYSTQDKECSTLKGRSLP